MKKHILLLKNPAATDWEDATPIGAGSVGAMVYGNVAEDKLVLNEEGIWSEAEQPEIKGFREKVDYLREKFLSGDIDGLSEWTKENLDDCFLRIKSYEYGGNLFISMYGDDECSDYSRKLSLNDGVGTVEYCKDGVSYKREFFASYPAKVAAYRLSADEFGCISFTMRYERENLLAKDVNGDTFTAKGLTAFGGHGFCVMIKVCAEGGSTEAVGDKIRVTGADSCVIYITAASEFTAYAFEKLCADRLAAVKNYRLLKKEHVADFSSVMERSDIEVSSGNFLKKLPAPKRLQFIREGCFDGGLVALYFQFGKYLLVSSSRPGTLPANLQGLWVEKLKNEWNSDYHTNINLQMNYWPAEVANISECTSAFFDYMNKLLLEGGKKVAARYYGCGGTVVHHVSDIYGFAAPADGAWGLWPLGGAWLCYHMWEHFLFTEDKEFLQNDAYEFIKQNVLFFLDYMFEDKNGVLHSGPSASPENSYYINGTKTKSFFLTMSPAMDTEIIGGLLRFFIKACDILGCDNELKEKASSALSKMPVLKVGKYGQLQEWLEDYEEVEPGHRHISHAFALYPDSYINKNTPELFRAIRTTLDRRLASGGGHTGWSRAWLINLFARLKDGENAYKNLSLLFAKSTLNNLLDTHAPFQIDGNFGGCAAIAEMLLQSHEGTIELLPAVPALYKDGSFERLMARGNIEVSAAWHGGKIASFTLTSGVNREKVIELPECQKTGMFTDGKKEYAVNNGKLTVSLAAGIPLTLRVL